VFVDAPGTFTKSGGSIYGSDAAATLKNTAANGANYGHAVYYDHSSSSLCKKRNTTAGIWVPMDSAVPGTPGGWE
jgi:hypothetical protein